MGERPLGSHRASTWLIETSDYPTAVLDGAVWLDACNCGIIKHWHWGFNQSLSNPDLHIRSERGKLNLFLQDGGNLDFNPDSLIEHQVLNPYFQNTHRDLQPGEEGQNSLKWILAETVFLLWLVWCTDHLVQSHFYQNFSKPECFGSPLKCFPQIWTSWSFLRVPL